MNSYLDIYNDNEYYKTILRYIYILINLLVLFFLIIQFIYAILVINLIISIHILKFLNRIINY